MYGRSDIKNLFFRKISFSKSNLLDRTYDIIEISKSKYALQGCRILNGKEKLYAQGIRKNVSSKIV